MCMFSGPSTSMDAPPPPPEPPQQAQRAPGGPEGTAARDREMDRRRARIGSQSTIRTSGRGLQTDEQTAGRQLLGA